MTFVSCCVGLLSLDEAEEGTTTTNEPTTSEPITPSEPDTTTSPGEGSCYDTGMIRCIVFHYQVSIYALDIHPLL